MINKYGLSRDIPAEVKRTIRQRCGFGCVICGFGIIQYEHVIPEFNEATRHDPCKMALLCPQCHARVTTGFWSKDKVLLAMESPLCKKRGYSRDLFDIGKGYPVLRFGGATIRNCPIPIQVGEMPLFKIEPQEEHGAPFRLSGLFCDSKGNVSLRIVENEWLASSANWDVEVTGGSILIREGAGNIHLKLVVCPPETLVVDRMRMFLGGILFEANGDLLRVNYPNGSCTEFVSCISDNNPVGMRF
jgi:hypothetical protein